MKPTDICIVLYVFTDPHSAAPEAEISAASVRGRNIHKLTGERRC